MGVLEISILAAYFALILAVGYWKGRNETGMEDYLVGRRQVPWWAVLGSLVATEISAATFLAVPAVGFSENMTYLQFGIGSFFARIFVATVFIGVFFQANCMSIYEYLRQRFGGTTQYTASLYFIITRLLGSGVRLMIAVTGFSVIIGLPFGWSLLLFGCVCLGYTFFGGIRAVIWTDCVQAVVFLSAGLLGFIWLIQQTGLGPMLETAQAAGRLEVIRLLPAAGQGPGSWLNDSQWLFTAVFFGFASTVAALGTDQDMVQRLLASRSSGLARRSLVVSGFIAVPVAALFLLLGVALFGYFQTFPDPDFPTRLAADGSLVADADRALPYFITTSIPGWLRGILLAGVLAAAMSSLDSAMAALSASAVRDLLLPLRRQSLPDTTWLWVSRWLTVVFAALLMAIAWLLKDSAAFLWLAFKITSLTYGSLLGVFLLGRFSHRGRDGTSAAAMVAGTAAALGLLWAIEAGHLELAWTWLLPIGAGVTFLVGVLFAEPGKSGYL